MRLGGPDFCSKAIAKSLFWPGIATEGSPSRANLALLRLDIQRRLAICFLLATLTVTVLACALNPNQLFQADTTLSASPVATPISAQPITLGLVSASDGLADLQSYRANLIVDFKGTRGGQPAQGRLESLTEVTHQPPALHHYLQVEATLPHTALIPGASEFYRMADKVYVKKGDEGRWLTFINGDVSPDALGFFQLEDLMVLPPSVSRPSQPELLDGLKVQHYSFTASDLAAPNLVFEQAQGDLWLAMPDNFLAQYVLSATLRVVIPDPKSHLFDQGHLRLRYTVSDINAHFDILPPQSVLAQSDPLSTLPRLPDAHIISVFPTFIEYTSAISPVSATLFYREALTIQGWTEDNLTVFNEKARLSYSKPGQALTILINPAGEGDEIKVLLDLR
jgi:hypothetical protein